MRLGFVLAGAATLPAAEFVEIVRETEARGYHTAWTGETAGYDAIAVMAAMATHSRTLHVGSAVVPVQTRTPTLLGMSAAALGHLAPGRIALGIGLSSRIIVEQWHGLRFSAALAQIREAVQIIRLVTAG
jgi:alkanesulfonate monooxygenase SsuD/methylene tetrahydromethanopterin reductase-like flavin-dependent oxidoreductase (luciferase family)